MGALFVNGKAISYTMCVIAERRIGFILQMLYSDFTISDFFAIKKIIESVIID